jgi:hypothetical protein
LALALRRYVAGRCTNDDLDSVNIDLRDRGAVAISQMAWQLYSEAYRHRAKGRHALDKQTRRTVARSVLFPHSEGEYLWPDYNFMRTAVGLLGVALTVGWLRRLEKRRWREFFEAGDFESWPFISNESGLAARANPRWFSRCWHLTLVRADAYWAALPPNRAAQHDVGRRLNGLA